MGGGERVKSLCLRLQYEVGNGPYTNEEAGDV